MNNLCRNQYMNKSLLYLTISIIYGCSNFSTAENQLYLSTTSPTPTFVECPQKPKTRLGKTDTKSLSLTANIITISDTVNSEKQLGYKFYARTGKDFNYRITSNVCIWIFAPDTKLLQRRELIIATQQDSPISGEQMSIDLPLTGEYIIQVSTPTKSSQFNLEMSLGDLPIPEPSVVSSETATSASPSTPISETSSTKASAEEAVKNYYSNLNQGKYQQAWNQLSSSFQNNQKLHPDGYNSYYDWWSGISNIVIQNVQQTNTSTDTSTINVQVKYTKKSGENITQSLELFLIWNSANNNWAIDAVTLN
ncbi:MAG: hypothetical protein F6K22_21220 [Okeania sp. SIO2F4]|uniref:hypothetical protein n=1 Tax=Okeania sp. SIO2F4 TaxID=2607790 RepID=UPI00142A1BBA|nr:hypothetical protein [Okeania sp. SIO2F4]NES05122.1 hypothetical protein [Okeania sp. SIO2F4]